MRSSLVPLIVAGLLWGCGSAAGPEAARAEYLGSWTWPKSARPAGGLSAIEVAEDGISITALTDDSQWIRARLIREGGRITGIEAMSSGVLHETTGTPMAEERNDSEGLAIAPDGRAWVAFEGDTRLWEYPDIDGPARPMAVHRDYPRMQANSALEALARGPDGVLYTLPERSGELDRPFTVYRYRDGALLPVWTLRRDPDFLPVGADFGPDGRFYLLERKFLGIFGFSSRVRRFSVTPDGFQDETLIFRSRTAKHDNLEGLGLWRDADGAIRLLMVSDDNNLPIQRTELVEYRLTE